MPERHEDGPEIQVIHPPGGSFYAMLFGDGSGGYPLLGALGFRQLRELGRYRDAWIERSPDGDPWIAVYTRLGGRNRLEYPEVIERLRANEFFLVDRDDTYDDTYAAFYFKLPPELLEILDGSWSEWRDHLKPTLDTNQMWRDALRMLGADPDAT